MPRRSSRRRKRNARSRRRAVVLVVMIFLLGGGILAVKWLETDSGRMALAEHDVGPARGWAEEHLERALREGLAAAAAPLDSLRRERPRPDGPILLRLGTEGSLFDLNLQVTTAVEAAGGHMLRGERRRDPDGDVLELHLGTAGHLTHRLVVSRGHEPPEPPPLPRGRLALVIDDVGHNLGPLLERLLALDAPLTLAVLPDLRYSGQALLRIERADKQALLHMPMEASSGAEFSPGPRSVEVGMAPERVRELVATCLDELPGVEGLNNHMGSEATRSRPEMLPVMEVLASRGLIFLDSLTTPRSVAHRVAGDLGVPFLKNDLFIDRETEDPDRVGQRLEKLARIARRRGWAVGIGHLNEATVEAIETFHRDLAPDDVQLVFLADLVHDRAQAR